jgi:hypothetical protein
MQLVEYAGDQWKEMKISSRNTKWKYSYINLESRNDICISKLIQFFRQFSLILTLCFYFLSSSAFFFIVYVTKNKKKQKVVTNYQILIVVHISLLFKISGLKISSCCYWLYLIRPTSSHTNDRGVKRYPSSNQIYLDR